MQCAFACTMIAMKRNVCSDRAQKINLETLKHLAYDSQRKLSLQKFWFYNGFSCIIVYPVLTSLNND
ncbi:hypothetical protein Pan54_35300 [Rubinisphaera italica]|uniref:Uncharacterized protein n=1 Tax=Rubinisphaera italica TaxID=2527969 RepID=A0A5C5XKW7_9PLAN|nr:hypothetical protein Pan54_35300 [Rubinisphaera italica]